MDIVNHILGVNRMDFDAGNRNNEIRSFAHSIVKVPLPYNKW